MPYNLYTKSNPGLLDTKGETIQNPSDWYHSHCAKTLMKTFANKYSKVNSDHQTRDGVALSFSLMNSGNTTEMSNVRTSNPPKEISHITGGKVSDYDTRVLLVKELEVPGLPNASSSTSKLLDVNLATGKEHKSIRSAPTDSKENKIFLPRVSRQTIVLKSGNGFHRHLRVSKFADYFPPNQESRDEEFDCSSLDVPARKSLPKEYAELRLPVAQSDKDKEEHFKETYVLRQKSQLNINFDNMESKLKRRSAKAFTPSPKSGSYKKKINVEKSDKLLSDVDSSDKSPKLVVFPTLPSSNKVPEPEQPKHAAAYEKHFSIPHVYKTKYNNFVSEKATMKVPASASIVSLPPASAQRKRPYSIPSSNEHKSTYDASVHTQMRPSTDSQASLPHVDVHLKSAMRNFKQIEVFENSKNKYNTTTAKVLFLKKTVDGSQLTVNRPPTYKLDHRQNTSRPSTYKNNQRTSVSGSDRKSRRKQTAPQEKLDSANRSKTVVSSVDVSNNAQLDQTNGSMKYRSYSLRSFSSKLNKR